MNCASLPDRRADLDPNGLAVSDGTRSLTNAGLLERVRAARRHLDELGVGAGDVVALKLRNRVEFVVLLFACWRLGATVTPVNPSLTDAEVTRQLRASGARLLVVEDGASLRAGLRRWPSGISTRRGRVGMGRHWWIRRRWRC
jgi:long-chain acyl-CoA synthetase